MEKLQAKVLEGETAKESSIIRNLREKKRLLDIGDKSHEEIKTAIVMSGGGVRGVYGAGVLLGLEELGYQDTFDLVVGVSSGAANLAYFLGGQTELGTALWYEDLIDKRFVDFRRLGKVLNLDYASEIMHKSKPLNQEAIRNSRSEFLIGVTNSVTGIGEFLEARDCPDIVDAIIASSALPVVYNRTVKINGTEFADGAVGNGIPIDAAIGRGCTDILVVLNNTVKDRANEASFFEKVLVAIYMRKFTSEFRNAMLLRHRQYSRAADLVELHGESVNIGIIAPTEMSISRISKDQEKIYALAMAGKEQVLKLFAS